MWTLFPCGEGNELFREIAFILCLSKLQKIIRVRDRKVYDELAMFIWEEVVNYSLEMISIRVNVSRYSDW